MARVFPLSEATENEAAATIARAVAEVAPRHWPPPRRGAPLLPREAVLLVVALCPRRRRRGGVPGRRGRHSRPRRVASPRGRQRCRRRSITWPAAPARPNPWRQAPPRRQRLRWQSRRHHALARARALSVGCACRSKSCAGARVLFLQSTYEDVGSTAEDQGSSAKGLSFSLSLAPLYSNTPPSLDGAPRHTLSHMWTSSLTYVDFSCPVVRLPLPSLSSQPLHLVGSLLAPFVALRRR